MRFLILSVGLALLFPVSAAFADIKSAMGVPAEMRACVTDADCVLVDRFCNRCCDYDAVNVLQRPAYDSLLERHCADDTAPSCDCIEPDIYPVCRDKICSTTNPFADKDGNVSYE